MQHELQVNVDQENSLGTHTHTHTRVCPLAVSYVHGCFKVRICYYFEMALCVLVNEKVNLYINQR